ncbi:MAG: hypothetical protein R6U29_08170 [Desulfosudaceae bacterium]
MTRLTILFLGLFLLAPLLPPAGAGEDFGRVRAMRQRAEDVTRQKNEFVALVLDSYKIPHQINQQGVVVRLKTKDQWHEVNSIEIVPVIKNNSNRPRRVEAHEIYFFTADGVLHLISELAIR